MFTVPLIDSNMFFFSWLVWIRIQTRSTCCIWLLYILSLLNSPAPFTWHPLSTFLFKKSDHLSCRLCLIAASWCSLGCHSIFHISCKLTVRSRCLIWLRFALFARWRWGVRDFMLCHIRWHEVSYCSTFPGGWIMFSAWCIFYSAPCQFST